LQNQLEQAYTELERGRAAIEAIHRDLATAETERTSRNRALTITVDSRGAVTRIKFNNNTYRTMAGAELAQLLVDTIALAREEAVARTAERFRSVLPAGTPLQGMLAGKVDLDGMVRAAMAAAAGDDEPTGGRTDER
jgi:DNA-binding protein YbaB